MDYLEGETWFEISQKKIHVDDKMRKTKDRFIDHFLHVMTENKLVHGDLQSPNIIVSHEFLCC